MSPEVKPKAPFPKHLQSPLRPSPHRTTSSISTVSVEAKVDAESRSLLSQDPKYVRARTHSLHASVSPPPTEELKMREAPEVQRTLSAPGTPGRAGVSRTASNYSLSVPSQSISGSSGSSPSRKGKERALENVEVEGVDVEGEMVTHNGDATKGLRELVRRTTIVDADGGLHAARERDTGRSRASSLHNEIHTLDPSKASRTYTPRRYYVLTHAGKPVFSQQDDTTSDTITNLMGVAQALISIFAEDDDKLRSINRDGQRIAFVLKAPLYFFCVSDWGEPEHVLRSHLEYIHLQIISVVSSAQLQKVFQRRSNFDLSRLLEGTEPFLRNLIRRSQFDFTYLTSTLQPLRLAPAVRDTAAAALMPPSKFNDLLYVLLIAGGHIVTLLRPRKHSIHPSDLHLLLNTIETSSTLRTAETWLPICLPKFNAAGFVHAYISFVLEDVGLVFVSADRDAFLELRTWKQTVVEKLDKDKTLAKIEQAIPLHPYSVASIECPGLLHFIYKSRQNVQVTSPTFDGIYENETDRNRVLTTYQQLHDSIHARSGQSTSLKLVYMKTDQEACLAWITKPFELYMSVIPGLPKAAVVAAANTVVRWVTAEESRIFLREAPVF